MNSANEIKSAEGLSRQDAFLFRGAVIALLLSLFTVGGIALKSAMVAAVSLSALELLSPAVFVLSLLQLLRHHHRSWRLSSAVFCSAAAGTVGAFAFSYILRLVQSM